MILKIFFRRMYDRILTFLEEENRTHTHPSIPSLQNADECLLGAKVECAARNRDCEHVTRSRDRECSNCCSEYQVHRNAAD